MPAPGCSGIRARNPTPPSVYLAEMRIRLPKLLALALVALLVGCHTADPYGGLEVGDLYALAVKEFDAGNYEKAQQAIDRLFVAFPNYERAPEAQLMLAETYVRREQYITAQAEFMRFIDRYPTNPAASDAALRRCRAASAQSPSVQRDQKPTEDAVVQCSNVVSDYPGTAAATEAGAVANAMTLKLAEKLYSVGDYYYRRKYYESSITYFQMIEDDYADTPWAPKALLGIMNAYEKIGYQDLVDETRQKILDAYPTSEEARGLADTGATPAAALGSVVR